MDKEKLIPINAINGTEINEELLEKIIPVPRRNESIFLFMFTPEYSDYNSSRIWWGRNIKYCLFLSK